MSLGFSYVIGSPLDRENFVGDLFFGDWVVAEVSNETFKQFEVVFYFYDEKKNWALPLNLVINGLNAIVADMRGEGIDESKWERY